ncbi:conserved hypothetical protein [Agrobacterium tumefaciens str. CFBP 5621]|nr:conserved hypothetical protein [Agrobacterium tumefaciens str. CFBP 5621]
MRLLMSRYVKGEYVQFEAMQRIKGKSVKLSYRFAELIF